VRILEQIRLLGAMCLLVLMGTKIVIYRLAAFTLPLSVLLFQRSEKG
jgi:hypothetical protein